MRATAAWVLQFVRSLLHVLREGLDIVDHNGEDRIVILLRSFQFFDSAGQSGVAGQNLAELQTPG